MYFFVAGIILKAKIPIFVVAKLHKITSVFRSVSGGLSRVRGFFV